MFREHDFLGSREQLVAADIGEEELQAVARARGARGRDRLRRLLLRLGLGRRLADLEPDALELAGELVDLVLVQLELEGERLQLGGLDIAALFRAGDDRPRLLSLE